VVNVDKATVVVDGNVGNPRPKERKPRDDLDLNKWGVDEAALQNAPDAKSLTARSVECAQELIVDGNVVDEAPFNGWVQEQPRRGAEQQTAS